ncbi:MAG TPA: TIGR02186 family protein [Hyphomicrobiaceae bacterium]|jgi:uncharacterized protein (TIGR02186 family)|nr:TIGR02186 family protein [Hyphomicrobiaceae bacterium]
MIRPRRHRSLAIILPALLAGILQALTGSSAEAQRRRAPPVAKEAPHSRVEEVKREQQPGAKETVQADVSARTVPVTSSFNGTQIVIFGAVDNSQQPSPESGYYDVVIVVEGVPGRVVSRRKSNVAGLWLNTSSATFDNVPSYYAVASSRPIEEIAPDEFWASHGIGLKHLRIPPAFGKAQGLTTEEVNDFRKAIIQIKEKQGLYVQAPFAAGFNGRSLFSAKIELPANVTVGPFETRVFLFHDEKLLSQYSVKLYLEREGLERHIHAFAFRQPVLYGLATVAIAIAAGLVASAIFNRSTP